MYKDVDERATVRVRFDCDTEGGSESFKANRNPVRVTATLERSTGMGAAYITVREVDSYLFAPRKYSWSRLNHYANMVVRALRDGTSLPGAEQARTAALTIDATPVAVAPAPAVAAARARR